MYVSSGLILNALCPHPVNCWMSNVFASSCCDMIDVGDFISLLAFHVYSVS
jgi:hypothetical protein